MFKNFNNKNLKGKNLKGGFSVQGIIIGSVISAVLATIGYSYYLPFYEKSKVNSIKNTYEAMSASAGLFVLQNGSFKTTNASKYKEYYLNKTEFDDRLILVKDKTTLEVLCSIMNRNVLDTEDNYDEIVGLEGLMKRGNNTKWFNSMTGGTGKSLLYSSTCSTTIMTNVNSDITVDVSVLNRNEIFGSYGLPNYIYDIIDATK